MNTPELLRVSGLCKSFTLRGGEGGHRRRTRFTAVQDVSFSVAAGQSVGIAGESGSGKSTLARMILRLSEPDSGRIVFAGKDITHARGGKLLAYRRQVQTVFQDSSAALSPRMRILELVAEPLLVQQPRLDPAVLTDRVDALLRRVGLSPQLRNNYPHELSGGQKQRVAIARSLIVDPSLVVLDEPVSALDVSVRSQVLNLLLDLQEERGLAYLIIAHDLAILRHVTAYLVVMKNGVVVERGPTDEVLLNPQHHYTRSLVAASPELPATGHNNFS